MQDEVIIDIENPKDNDLISRQAAIDAFERFIHELGIEDEPYNYGEMALSVKNVPPVTHKPIECDDAISRQAALDLCERFDGCVPYSVLSSYDILPPVTHKTGKWILTKDGFECTECGCISRSRADFCQYCGAKMESEV